MAIFANMTECSALKTLTAIVLISLLRSGYGYTSGNETLLKATLFTTNNYDASVRPDEPTTINLSLVPTSLNSIDTRGQTMSISGWWVMSWSDSRLTWNPGNYDYISETHVFEDTVWTPSIVVYNSVNDLSAIDEDTIPVKVSSSGMLEWNPPGIMTVSCSTDITHFPFDIQTCGVSVQSFGYTVQQVVLETGTTAVDLGYYSQNGEWRLLTTWAEKINNNSQVTFNLKFKRKPEFYGLNLILPVVLMSVLSLFIFMLPAESGEKMGFSLTVMLTFVVLMSLLGNQMPTTADHTSFFEVYVILVLGLCGLSVVLNIISLHLFFKQDHEAIPSWLRGVTRILQRLMCKNGNKTKDTNIAADEVDSVLEGRARNLTNIKSINGRAPNQPEVTWQLMSRVMDAFMLRVYIVLVTILTIVFLAIVASN